MSICDTIYQSVASVQKGRISSLFMTNEGHVGIAYVNNFSKMMQFIKLSIAAACFFFQQEDSRVFSFKATEARLIGKCEVIGLRNEFDMRPGDVYKPMLII